MNIYIIPGAMQVQCEVAEDLWLTVNKDGLLEILADVEQYTWATFDPCLLTTMLMLWEEWDEAEWVGKDSNARSLRFG